MSVVQTRRAYVERLAEYLDAYLGMPRMETRSITDADLLMMYDRMAAALDEAQVWRAKLDAALSQSSIPTRIRAVS